eukprot:3373621-Ditylum_brightwellii.AAC.1
MEMERAGRLRRKEETYKDIRETVEEEYTGDQKQGIDCTLKSPNHWISVVSCMTNNTVICK